MKKNKNCKVLVIIPDNYKINKKEFKMVNLLLETSNYQVFDMKYGVTLLDRNANRDNDQKTYRNIFMQGDDAENFTKEIENLISSKIKNEFIDHFLSAYDEISASYSTVEELGKIGITVREKRNTLKK